jgi:UDP-N-acetylglucosamine 2-epimerase (non-hydrolysing)
VSDLLIVVGARPNFMKAAPIVAAARAAGITCSLVHTGQHYDPALSQIFFDELELPPPDVSLGVGSGSHATQTARVMLAFEQELLRIDPQIVLVVGDVNSTLACALVAIKEHYPVAHVEAGLRCFDPWMPEEINRRLCDHLSTYLLTTSRDADENLAREGIPAERITFVGNTMIDTLVRFAQAARERRAYERFGVAPGGYCVATLHRPDTVDHPDMLEAVVGALHTIGEDVPVVFPVHPRTRQRLRRHALTADAGAVRLAEPLGYLDFLGLVADARLVLTDSGGVQEETTVLDVPCLTLRPSTERPVTVTAGTNRVIGTDPSRIVGEARAVLSDPSPRAGTVPELWDGRAAERIVALLSAELRYGSGALAGVG